MHGKRRETHTKFWSEILRGRDHAEDLGVDERIILECISGKQCERVWLKIGTGGGFL
jgi:hypothetical protein